MASDLAIQELGAARAETDGPAAEPRQWDVLDRLEKSAAGTRLSDGSVAIGRSEPAGCVLYGPYWQLPAGSYRLSFACRVGSGRYRTQPVLGVEVILLNRVQQAWRDFTADELTGGAGEVLFEVAEEVSREAHNEGRFEFRFFHLGVADLAITASRLERLEPGEAAAEAERRWRLLGRLEHSPRAKRHPDGSVSTRRLSRSGVLLYGGWPYLRLPRGRYRLRISGRRRAPDTADPALAVEVVGHSRWRDRGMLRAALSAGAARPGTLVRREFTGRELGGGGAAFEFAVPTELSIDAGLDAPFEFRVFQIGGAGLTVAALDLYRIEGDEAVSGTLPSPAVHPLRRKNIVLIGNCQSEIVKQGFTRVESLNEQFHATYHFVTLPTNLYEFARHDLEAADILLVQDIRDWENFALRDCIRPDIETIRFPSVRFASLWPFDGWNGPSDNEAYHREAPNLTFAYLDGLLARLRREIPDPEQRFAAYRALDCPGVINYRRLHDFEERRLLALDRKFDIEIGAYILDQFRKRRIFHTTVRPNRQLLDMLMQYILRSIGVRGRHKLPEHVETLLCNPQVPVHPKVAHELGVKWADEKTRYLHGGRKVTWETYIRSYIEHYG
jgi:Polysaccharide biosynthesis enzyme WcbI